MLRINPGVRGLTLTPEYLGQLNLSWADVAIYRDIRDSTEIVDFTSFYGIFL